MRLFHCTLIITAALNNRVSYKQTHDFTLILLLLTIANRNLRHISTGGRRLRWAAAAVASRHRLVFVLEFLRRPDWLPEDQSDRRARPIKLKELDQVSTLYLLFRCWETLHG